MMLQGGIKGRRIKNSSPETKETLKLLLELLCTDYKNLFEH
jgi:hypothetical protein